MGLLTKSADAVEELLARMSRFMVGKDLASYCDLRTAMGLTDNDVARNPGDTEPYIAVTSQRALLTVFDIQGTFEMVSRNDFQGMLAYLREKWDSTFREYGHKLVSGFERDPERSYDEWMRLCDPMIQSARRMGTGSEDLVLDRLRRNAPLVQWEQNLLFVYTFPIALEKHDQKAEVKAAMRKVKESDALPAEFGQSAGLILLALKHRHDAVIESMADDLLKCGSGDRAGFMARRLDVHEAMRRVRVMVNRDRTSQLWRPQLPGDRLMLRGPADALDASDATYPILNYQVCTNDLEIDGRFINTDGLLHATVALSLGPQVASPFAFLVDKLPREMPWRVRIDIEPRGLDRHRTKRVMLALVGQWGENKYIRESLAELDSVNKDDAVMVMKVSASTWGRDKDTIRRRLANLETSLQGWGVTGVTSTFGDPVEAWASTIPGMTASSVATTLVPPLSDALTMLPLQRPATPWASGGDVLLRTPGGKIFPIDQASKLQDHHLSLVSAPPGSGKSAFLSTLNLAAMHRPGNIRLPLLFVIDVGFSARYLMEGIRDDLPEEKKHQVEAITLHNDSAHCVNVFDLQLGASYPQPMEISFLRTFLLTIFVDAALGTAPSECGPLADALLHDTYTRLSSSDAYPYERHVSAEVDKVLDKGLRDTKDASWWKHATWYEIRDLLFTHGHVFEALCAQRMAVPTLPDFSNSLNAPSIKTLFQSAMVGNEPLLSFAARRLTMASKSYAMFAGRTRFNLGSETRMVAIDIRPVLGDKTPDGRVRSALMYMFARQLIFAQFFIDEDTIFDGTLPLYHAYQTQRLADLKDEIKFMRYDEVHNMKELEAPAAMLEKDAREGRKGGINITLISQYLSDHHPIIRASATSIYVMRGGNTEDERVLREEFKATDAIINALNRDAKGPDAKLGGNLLAIFKTRLGRVMQILTNTIGPAELWMSTTMPADVALRSRIATALGGAIGRELLVKKFPKGTAADTIEQMRMTAKADDTEEVPVSIIAELANQLLREYREQGI